MDDASDSPIVEKVVAALLMVLVEVGGSGGGNHRISLTPPCFLTGVVTSFVIMAYHSLIIPPSFSPLILAPRSTQRRSKQNHKRPQAQGALYILSINQIQFKPASIPNYMQHSPANICSANFPSSKEMQFIITTTLNNLQSLQPPSNQQPAQ